MKREMINFFGDSSSSTAHPSASEPRFDSSPEMGMSLQRGDRRHYMTRQMHNVSRSLHEQFSRPHAEVGIVWRGNQSINYPVLGILQPEPAFGAPLAVTLEIYFQGGAAARFANDAGPFISVWNGVRVVHSHLIPSGGEELDDRGTGLITRNFLWAMEQPLNPELVTVTDPIVELDHEEVHLDLKL